MTKQEQDIDTVPVSPIRETGARPAWALFDGSIFMDKGRPVWVPCGLSGPEIVSLANLICEETDLECGGARVLAIRLLSELQRLRGA